MKKYTFLALVGLIFGLWSLVILVPPNMDEFIKYHRLACWAFDGSQFSIFQEGCDKYPASFLGTLFHRNYQYIGILSNYLYAPFYYLAPNIYSHYLFGFLCLIAFSLLLVKSLGVRRECVLIPMTFFPLLYLMVHDHGPANLSLITYPLIFLLTQNFLKENISLNQKIAISLGFFFVILIGLDEKVFYLYLIPQILVISAAVTLYRGDGVNQAQLISLHNLELLKRITLVVLIIGLTSLGYLFLIKTEGVTYFRYLVELKKIQIREIQISYHDIYNALIQFTSIPYSFPHRIYHLDGSCLKISQLFFSPLLLIAALTLVKCKNKLSASILVLSEVTLAIIFFITKNVWASHHFIFLLVPIIILLMIFAHQSTKKFGLVITLLFINLLVNVQLLSSSTIQGHARLGQNGIFKYLSDEEIAKDSLINFSSFGGYFILSLYGNKQQVVTWKDINKVNSGEPLAQTSKQASRQYILNVCEGCGIELMRTAFPGSRIEKVGPTDPTWVIWKISPN